MKAERAQGVLQKFQQILSGKIFLSGGQKRQKTAISDNFLSLMAGAGERCKEKRNGMRWKVCNFNDYHFQGIENLRLEMA